MTIWSWLIPNLICVSVLVAVVWLLCLRLKHRPAWRHALWLVVLVKMVTPPLIAWPWSVSQIAGYVLPESEPAAIAEREPEPFVPASESAPVPVTSPLAESGFTGSDNEKFDEIPVFIPVKPPNVPVLPGTENLVADGSLLPIAFQDDTSIEARPEANATVLPQTPVAAKPLLSAEIVAAGRRSLLCLWIAGGISLLIVHLRRLLQQRKLIRRGEPAAQRLVDDVASVSRLLKLKPVVAMVVKRITSPFLWCLGRPRLIWPESMTDEESLRQSRAIIAHELAHIRRRDHWVAWLELAAGALWWWNPLFWFVRHRLRESAEMSCDAVALNLYDDRKAYAQLFLQLSSQRQTGVAVPVLGVSTGNRSSLERRIEMIMSDRVSGRISVWGVVAVICFAAMALPSLSVGQDDSLLEPETASAISEDSFTADARSDATVVSDPLQAKVRQAIELTRHRDLDASRHRPWQIMHGVLAFRRDFEIKVDGKRVNALDWIRQGQSFRDEPWIEKTRDGARFHTFTEPYIFEGHPNQFLAILAMLDLPRDFTFESSAGPVSIVEMVEQAKLSVSNDAEHAWTLWALSSYLPSDASWRNDKGEQWSIERLVESQSQADLDRSPCGGTIGLSALAHACRQRLDENRELNGVWAVADQVVKQHIDMARTLQHSDGTFSCGYFAQQKYEEEFGERLAATGHTLEFLMMAVSDDELDEPWIRKGVAQIADDLIDSSQQGVDCGPLFHAVNGLMLYLERTGPPATGSNSDESAFERVADATSDEPATKARKLTVSERLAGSWVLTDRQPEQHVEFMMIHIDPDNRRFISCWKKGAESGFSEARFTIDAPQSPHHLTIDTGNGNPMLFIFELKGEQLKIACFDRDEVAVKTRPISFQEYRANAGPLVVETFRRVKTLPVESRLQSTDPTSAPVKPLASLVERPATYAETPAESERVPSNTPAKTSVYPPGALINEAQPSKAEPTRNQNQAGSVPGVNLLASQTLPELTVSPDEEIQKLQRRWLEMNVESAKSSYDVESKVCEFQVRMSEKGYVSEADLEQARAQLRQKELQIERAQIMVQMFELQVKQMGPPQPSKLTLPRSSNPAGSDLNLSGAPSQSLPEFNISSDEEVRKVQRRLLELDVETASDEYEAASSMYERQKKLSEKGAVSSAGLDKARTELQRKKYQLERSKIMLELFERQAQHKDEEAKRVY